jgi:acetyl-CoA synthetase
MENSVDYNLHHTKPTNVQMLDPSEQARVWLDEYSHPVGSVAYYLCDRHDGAKIALRYEDANGNRQAFTFAQLRELSERFASVLCDLGVTKGDRVATLMPKSPELVIALLAIWRLGAVHVPLFTAFGPQAVAYRVENSGARVVVTDSANRSKLNGNAEGAYAVDTEQVRVVTVSRQDGVPLCPGDVSFREALETATPFRESITVSGDDLFILLYTSGTTGHPKGVEVPVRALAAFEAYMRFGLDLRDDDVFWNIADPGWAYGLYYGIVGPFLLGNANILFNAPFKVEEAYRILEEYGVTNFAAAPTVYRSMRAKGVPTGLKNQLRLRVLSSAGEPLNPDVVTWAEEHFGVPIHDHYGQTELGMVVMNHQYPALRRPLRPGSMGHAMPGYRVVLVDSEGNELPDGTEGQVAVDTEQSPILWFRGYYGDPERTAERFSAGSRYYCTGDAGSRDADGYIYFSGRADDIISSAGYRIGPFEIENALMGHKAVAEAAAVGVPDERRGEVVKAFVVLREGFAPSSELAKELSEFVKGNLAAHAYPREIEFIDALPKTPSGKVQRFLLRQK